MALNTVFYEAVNSGNVRDVRIMMKNSLLVDPTFSEFKEMEKAAGSMRGLFDIHDGQEFITDSSKWDDKYMNMLMVQVVGNFSHERIEHLKRVVHQLRPVADTAQMSHPSEIKRTASQGTRSSYEEQKRRDQQEGMYLGAKIASGAVAGAIVGGVAASVAGVTVVGGVALGAVAGGIVTAVAVKGGI